MSDPLHRRFTDLSATIKALTAKAQSPVLVAIDGRSGAGKSTLADALAALVSCTLIRGDDFFAGGVEVHDLTPEALADICIDRTSLNSVLETLKAGNAASFAAFDWEAFDGRLAQAETRLEPNPLLILEGVYAFHPDFRNLVDYAVLVETPNAERTRRLLAREGEISDWERQWQRAEDWYFHNLSPAELFDAVIENV